AAEPYESHYSQHPKSHVQRLWTHLGQPLFSRLGHLLVALCKPRQLPATDRIGEAIGQRSTFLSAGSPALGAGHRQHPVLELISIREGGNDSGETTKKPRHFH